MSALPEPAAYILLGLSAAGLALRLAIFFRQPSRPVQAAREEAP